MTTIIQLPYELKLLLLEFIVDAKDLVSLVKLDHDFYDAVYQYPQIFYKLMGNGGPDFLPTAMLLYNSQTLLGRKSPTGNELKELWKLVAERHESLFRLPFRPKVEELYEEV